MFLNAFCATLGVLFGILVFFVLIIFACAAIVANTEDDEDGD